MIAAYTSSEIVVIIGACVAGITTIVGAIFAGLAAYRVTQVHTEIRTLNAKTIGVLAGEDETRRIEAKDPADRTTGEQRHLLDVPPEPGNT